MAYGSYVLRPHWEYPGEGPNGWDAAYFGDGPQAGANFANTAYVHVFERGGWPGYSSDVTVIQYYYFYPYNDWVNNHEGDWPRIHVVLSGRDPQTAEVLGVEYLFHGKALSYYDHYDPVGEIGRAHV